MGLVSLQKADSSDRRWAAHAADRLSLARSPSHARNAQVRCAVGGVLLGLVSTCAAESIDEFAYALRVDTPRGGALYRVSLPQSVYEGIARADLGDVRVF